MNKEQWKKLYQEHAYLFERFGSFYRIGIGLCIDSLGEDEEIEDFAALNKRYEEWSESKEGKKSNSVILQILSDETDAKIQIGLDSIAKGNYSKTDSRPYLGTYTVQDNETKLWGLITEEGEEILPCIFGSVLVHMGTYFEAQFKGLCCEFDLVHPGHRKKIEEEYKGENPQRSYDKFEFEGNWVCDSPFFIYGETGVYSLSKLYNGTLSFPNVKCYTTLTLEEVAKNLIELLRKNHGIKCSEE